jgi:hypothetical protein
VAIKVAIPTPFAAQQELLERDAAQFNVVHGGELSGKTTLAIMLALISGRGALREGRHRVVFVAPSRAEIDAIKLDIINRTRAALVDGQKGEHARLDFKTQGSIHFVAADDEKLRLWEPFDLLIVDDAAKIPRLPGLWRSQFSQLLKSTGAVWFISKPEGNKGFFFDLAQRFMQEARWASHELPTSANERFGVERLERDRVEMSVDTFAQERLGQFVSSAVLLTASQQIISPDETFRQWCGRLGRDGLKVDGRPFRLDDRPAMHFIYDMIPSTLEDAHGRIDVIMKPSQVGFTVMEILAMMYLGLKFSPGKIGFFMPTQLAANNKSNKRFLPIVRTVPRAYELMTDESGGEGNVHSRSIGDAEFHFLWTSGKATTESLPLDAIAFDEVQEMAIEDMEKTRERLSASPLRYILMGSTANWPEEDIHWWYLRGTQHRFHTQCPSCGVEQILDEHFPECIGFDPEALRLNERDRADGLVGEYRYVCHACKGWIDDPQLGRWIPDNPTATIRSVHFSQILSPTISPREIAEAWTGAKDKKSFYNRKLGKPYIDPTQIPVNMTMLAECAALGQKLGVAWKKGARDTFGAIDQMGNFNVMLIGERLRSGHMAIIHAEEIYGADPFARCDELMNEFGVQVCAVERTPNYNEAMRFAHRHRGRVFVVDWQQMDDMLRWGDTKPDKSERKTEEDARNQFAVKADQYKTFAFALGRIADKQIVFPDPRELVQSLAPDGDALSSVRKTEPLLPRVFDHLCRVALANEQTDSGRTRYFVKKVSGDPHFAFAFSMLNLAWSRLHTSARLVWSEVDSDDLYEPPAPTVRPMVPLIEHVHSQIPMVADLREELHQHLEGRCGGCDDFIAARGWCNHRGFGVTPDLPGCDDYYERR